MAGNQTMAELLQIILTGVYGRDIRQAIHDAIEMCYDDVDTSSTLAMTSAVNANSAANTASQAAADAENSAANANLASVNAESIANIIAPTFSIYGTYAVGSIVIYNGALYRCTYEVSGGEWDSTKWELIPGGIVSLL